MVLHAVGAPALSSVATAVAEEKATKLGPLRRQTCGKGLPPVGVEQPTGRVRQKASREKPRRLCGEGCQSA